MDSNYIEVLKQSLAKFEKVNRTQELKINYQQKTIEELESKLQDQENILTDNMQLSNEVKRLNEILFEKNRIISEFQQLSQVSTLKFESYINTNKQNQEAFDKKVKKYENLKAKYTPLTLKCNELEQENSKLLMTLEEKTNMNIKEISNLNNQLSDVTIKYNILKEENEKVKNENSKLNYEINELRNNLSDMGRLNRENENSKIELSNLQQEISELNAKNQILEQNNYDLKRKNNDLENSIRNKIIFGNELEKKVSDLSSINEKNENENNLLYNELEKRKRDYEKIYLELEGKKEEYGISEEKYKKEIHLLQIEISELRKRESLLKNSMLQLNNTIKNEPTTNTFQNNISNTFQNTFSKLDNNTLKSTQGNLNSTQNNSYNTNSNFFSFNPEKNQNIENDESFKYSYFLIDNLKNAINKVDFQNEYSNLI